MKRGELVCATIGLAALALAAWLLAATSPPRREEIVTVSGCELRMTILGRDDARAKAVLFHGLTANRRTMLQLGRTLAGQMQVFILDHPGHGDSTQPFSYERAEACAATAVNWLEQQGRIRLENTALIGHSMGAGIAIRLADQFPTAATVSISTAMRKPVVGNPLRLEPVALPRRMPVNLFLINAEYDWLELKEVSRRMVHAAGGERYDAQDFDQRRAFRWETFRGATHTSLIFDSQVHAAIRWWIDKAMGSVPTPDGSLAPRILGIVAGLAGLLLVFPLVASLVCGASGEKQAVPAHAAGSWTAFAVWPAAALVAVLLQFRFTTLGPVVRMYSGDYLASVLMVVGVVVMVWQVRARHAVPLQTNWGLKAVAAGALLGMAAMLAFGGWLNWQITNTWLNAPRWWRFTVLVPLVLPYFVAEEIALGVPPSAWLARAGRFARFLTLRAILWLAMAFGLFVLGSAQVLMVLLVIYMVAFSIAQRAGMDAVRRRTSSAAAAAVFGAILAAWFIAAVFPIT